MASQSVASACDRVKMIGQRMAWLAAGVLLAVNVALRITAASPSLSAAPPSLSSAAVFQPPQKVRERAWLLHDDPSCKPDESNQARTERAATLYLEALRARGSREEALPMAANLWSLGNDRGMPVIYIPCRGTFRVLPSLWTEMKSQGAGALP